MTLNEELKLALDGITKVPTLTHGCLVKLADVDAVIDKTLAQPMQELDCNDCENANRSEQVGPCADCIPFFPVRPMFMAKKLTPPLPVQPAQKPVAWMLDGEFYKTQQFHLQGGHYANQIPLYTTPPQRTWVGLTPEDILDLFDEQNLYGSKLVEFTRAVEAKIKDKNNG